MQKVNGKVWDAVKENVRELCKLRGISEAELCAEMGVSASYMRKDRADVPVNKLIRLGEIFGVEWYKLADSEFTCRIRLEAIQKEIERLITLETQLQEQIEEQEK